MDTKKSDCEIKELVAFGDKIDPVRYCVPHMIVCSFYMSNSKVITLPEGAMEL